MTPQAALDFQIKRYREMSGEERLAIALDLHELSCDIAREGIRAQHPNASDEEATQLRKKAEALRQVGLALESGGVPYMILGQLGWFVREKLAASDARRVPAAVEALFRTDLELKSSGGDPRVLLERLVVELCSR